MEGKGGGWCSGGTGEIQRGGTGREGEEEEVEISWEGVFGSRGGGGVCVEFGEEIIVYSLIFRSESGIL